MTVVGAIPCAQSLHLGSNMCSVDGLPGRTATGVHKVISQKQLFLVLLHRVSSTAG